MPLEIERKFLVTGDFKKESTQSIQIIQGYISSQPERTVRIRIRDDQGFLTIKGKTNTTGMSRYEWEKEIPIQEAHELLQICEPGVISKTRYIVPTQENLFFEVDEFHNENNGLLLAEIELPREDYPFNKPPWLGEEVTGDTKYYNAYLASHPYKTW